MAEENSMVEELEVSKLFTSMRDAWNRHDMKAFASVFSEDADFVNVAGMLWKGRNEIELKHAKAHEFQLKESSLEIQKIEVKFIRPDVAIVHMDSIVRGDKDPDGTLRIRARNAILTGVAAKVNGAWHIVAAQNSNKV